MKMEWYSTEYALGIIQAEQGSVRGRLFQILEGLQWLVPAGTQLQS